MSGASVKEWQHTGPVNPANGVKRMTDEELASLYMTDTGVSKANPGVTFHSVNTWIARRALDATERALRNQTQFWLLGKDYFVESREWDYAKTRTAYVFRIIESRLATPAPGLPSAPGESMLAGDVQRVGGFTMDEINAMPWEKARVLLGMNTEPDGIYG